MPAPSIRTAALALTILLLGGCRKQDEEVPYYQFTADDRLWLQHQRGDEWRFENGRGQQRVYRVSSVVDQAKQPFKKAAHPLAGLKLRYYYDSWQMNVARVDSPSGADTFDFRRPLPPYERLEEWEPTDGGAFFAAGSWQDFIGSRRLDGALVCQQLGFPTDADAATAPHAPLTVRGHRYEHVLTFDTDGLPFQCGGAGQPRPKLYRLHYDRQYGLVRMESVNGEV
jgi:hypothetical protein